MRKWIKIEGDAYSGVWESEDGKFLLTKNYESIPGGNGNTCCNYKYMGKRNGCFRRMV